MMFQSYALFPHLSVRDNVAFALRVRGLSKAERYKTTDAMLEKVRLTELADRLPGHLSGGQQQRVALARAAITEPRVLLLDEPLSALDEQLRIQMRTELRRMQRELGITFVHVTHTQLEAIALADLVVVMEKGKIKQAGPAREVYAEPRDRYVAEFLGGQNVLSGKSRDGQRREPHRERAGRERHRRAAAGHGRRRSAATTSMSPCGATTSSCAARFRERAAGLECSQHAHPGDRVPGIFRESDAGYDRRERVRRVRAGAPVLRRSRSTSATSCAGDLAARALAAARLSLYCSGDNQMKINFKLNGKPVSLDVGSERAGIRSWCARGSV